MAVIDEHRAVRRGSWQTAVWLVVWAELIVFGALLLGLVVMSYLHADDFSIAKLHLNSRLASINTLVLITSGWFAAEASRACEDMSLVGAAALGLVFALVKLLEYQDEIRFLGDATFNSCYRLCFVKTGLHLAHVVFLSIAMLLVLQRPDHDRVSAVTTVWHVIGMVWLVIFPVVYLG